MKNKNGSALVEFASVLPLLLLLCLAVGDFGRVFKDAENTAGASSTGALWGSLSTGNSAQSAKMQEKALDDATELKGVSATATQFCECPPADPDDFTSLGTLVSCDLAGIEGTCTAGTLGLPRVYVKVDVTSDFETIGPYPGIPEYTALGNASFTRVQ